MDASGDKQWTPDQGSLPVTVDQSGMQIDNFGIKLLLSQNWGACVYTGIWKKGLRSSRAPEIMSARDQLRVD